MNKIGSTATSVSSTNGRLSVRYHATEVVAADLSNGIVTLDSGGWHSYTTKARMNQASNQFGLGYTVAQKDHSWFVHVNGQTLPFTDGMTFNAR
jgi:hypothetical protein